MIVIGERINTSRAPVEKAVADRDAEYIRQDVQAQEAAGAAYIDVNAAARIGHEMEDMMPFLRGKECEVIALCMDDTGLPESAEAVAERAQRLIKGLKGVGFPEERIHVDPLIQPISTDQTKGLMTLEAVARIREESPEVHFTCGLSNISYGLPVRQVINRSFLALLMGAGLDGAIIDPLDQKLMAAVKAVDMLLANDEFCGAYLEAVRAGQITS